MGKELLLFAKSLWYGSLLAIIYDGLRIWRRVIEHGNKGIAFEDLLFWIGSSLFLFSRFYRENEGVLRAYLFAGTAAGVLAWHYSLSTMFVEWLSGLLNKVKKILLIPAGKILILGKRLKLWARRVKIGICACQVRFRDKWKGKVKQNMRAERRSRSDRLDASGKRNKNGKKEECQKKEKHKAQAPKYPE
jgi:spore cortex biosynthesis protein YabQ